MTRGSVRCFLVAYFAVAFSAVALRIDRFPLTWVPMYSVYKPRPEAEMFRIHFKDKERADRGFRATRADGSESWVSRKQLNVPGRNMWRLYYERAFGRPPPKYRHANTNLDPVSRWVRGLDEGERNLRANWRRRVITLVNRTLGYAPGDPGFIVRLAAERDTFHFDRETLELSGSGRSASVIEWKRRWTEAW